MALHTWGHRITMTVFRLCSTCQSRSQASLCHCTRQLISDQLELTIARLRYSLGGDRPSQTTHHTLSQTSMRDRGETSMSPRVVFHISAPRKLAPPLQSLPPMLHMPARMP